MPSKQLRNMAKKSGKPLSKIEQYWKEAKEIAAEKMSKSSSGYWPYVMKIVMNMSGLSEAKLADRIVQEAIVDDFIKWIKKNRKEFKNMPVYSFIKLANSKFPKIRKEIMMRVYDDMELYKGI